MSLVPGTKLGPYQILSALGAGGMGEVYRAHDPRLKRDVAIKVLLPEVAQDPERLARFEREAQILASLNHPHIAAIYGAERAGDTTALILEFIDGPTLADRIARGPVPLDEALAIAKQIAEALEAAHEQGIIHRDLKPTNVKVRLDGTVKVLDFGLAKALEPTRASSATAAQSNSPTLASPAVMTGEHAILGTAAYMSPEQAKGRPTDARSDVWAFGCVLYEMLTGRRAFDRDSIPETLAAVLSEEPDWTALPDSTPHYVSRVLRRCLQKDRKDRLAAIADARLELAEADSSPGHAGKIDSADGSRRPAATDAPPSHWRLVALGLATALIVVAGIYLYQPGRTPAAAAQEIRADLVTPASNDPMSLALSPDGRSLAFVATSEGVSRLWLRSLTSATAQPLSGTERASYPFWSPDSRAIAFFADGYLKRLDLGGGLPRTLTVATNGRGGTWADGIILFCPNTSAPIFRVNEAGGPAAPLTSLSRQTSHRFPVFLPDGRHFLFYAQGAADTSGIFLAESATGNATRLTPASGSGAVLNDWLLWLRDGSLVAQPLDVANQRLTAAPVQFADAAGGGDASGASGISVSNAGLIAYRAGAGPRQLTWFDRAGRAVGTFGAPDRQALAAISLSPDDQRVVASRSTNGNTDIWVLDPVRMNRVTFDAAQDMYPLWTADGARIVFNSVRAGQWDVYTRSLNGSEQETSLLKTEDLRTSTHVHDEYVLSSDVAPDDQSLLFMRIGPQGNRDLGALALTPGAKPNADVSTPFNERWAKFSPDGKWVAYQSDETGRLEIFVRPFIQTDAEANQAKRLTGKWQVSDTGGVYPLWSPNSREVYYISPMGDLMAAPVDWAATGTPHIGSPRALFRAPIYGGGADTSQGYQYAVAKDGRFLVNTVLEDAAAPPITMIINWTPPR